MDFFSKLGDTIANVGKDVTQKAKDVSGIAKLKLDIKAKEDFIKEQYIELGKAYYEKNKGMDVPEKVQFDRIEEAMEDISKMELLILEIKKARRCPECGAEAAETAEFCSVCGKKLSIVVEDYPYEEEEIVKGEAAVTVNTED
ncbi:MAG: zinc ribbon domain-containing protein [Lachnospiraceae bacterium]|nr:zinc ribbon domain-containing protein [Lachnospiraceae bacterium]